MLIGMSLKCANEGRTLSVFWSSPSMAFWTPHHSKVTSPSNCPTCNGLLPEINGLVKKGRKLLNLTELMTTAEHFGRILDKTIKLLASQWQPLWGQRPRIIPRPPTVYPPRALLSEHWPRNQSLSCNQLEKRLSSKAVCTFFSMSSDAPIPAPKGGSPDVPPPRIDKTPRDLLINCYQ